jgi:hypothetical protein
MWTGGVVVRRRVRGGAAAAALHYTRGQLPRGLRRALAVETRADGDPQLVPDLYDGG